MDEQKKEGSVDIIAPSAEQKNTESDTKNNPPAEAVVSLVITKDGEADEQADERKVRFHTPTMLAEVSKLDDACTLKITVVDPGAETPRTLTEGTKAEVVAALEKSIIPAEHVAGELRKFAQFLLDHSNLKAIGCHAVCTMDDGKDGGFGFAATASDCTSGQAITFVNCGDANMDEFVSRAKLDIPGRNGATDRGVVVAPTQEQVAELG